MRALLTVVALLVAAPAAAQVLVPQRVDPLRPQTQLDMDRTARQRLDTSAELQRQSSQLHALEAQRLRSDLLQQQIRTRQAQRMVDESAPPTLPPADRARIAKDAAEEIGQIDRWLNAPN